jgi:secreted trypsin-like serine protease
VPIESNSSGLLRYTTSTVTGGLASARKSGGQEELQFIPNTRTSEIAVDQTRGRGPCLGDSGGPAYTLVASKLYLWGVSSRGDASCSSQAIYTNILSYLPWIEKASQELLLPIKK